MENRQTAGPGEPVVGAMRRFLLALLLFGMVGLLTELFLLEHTESVWQWFPLVVLAGGLVTGAAIAARPSHGRLRAFQAVMVTAILAGLLGLFLHLDGNAEFELESDPTLGGLDLFWRSIQGATPALAPGAMVQLGLLGLTYAYRHPALRARSGRWRSSGTAEADQRS